MSPTTTHDALANTFATPANDARGTDDMEYEQVQDKLRALMQEHGISPGDAKRAIEDDIAAQAEAARRAKDCPVCREPEHAPCNVDMHEEAAKAYERTSIAAWLREHSDDDALMSERGFDAGNWSNTYADVLDMDKIAKAIEEGRAST